MLQVRLLGQFDVRLNGQPVELNSRPAQLLLANLLLTAGTPHRRDQLAARFWPDTTETNARSNLRHALWRLRSAVGDGYVMADTQTVAFNTQADYWLDTEALQQEFSGDWPTDELIEALSHCQGDLLPGFYADWLDLERDRLRTAFEAQMQTLLDRLVSEGRWPETLTWAERWLTKGNTPEPAFRALLLAHAAQGNLAALANVYQRCIDSLRDQLGVDPSPQTRALYERLLNGDGQPASPSRTVSPSQAVSVASHPTTQPPNNQTPSHNLPAQTTGFIGREEQLAEIARHLADPACRLVTLIGPGGIGKTRLALQAAHTNLAQFSNGVFFVPLAPVGSAELIVPAIAQALAYSFYGGGDQTEQLFNHLRDKCLLLVLDNFEHLVEGSEVIAQLLERAPQVKCLVTSRERLNLQGEWMIAVEGLGVPERDDVLTPEEYSAMQLLLQCARRAQAGFALATADIGQAIRICRLVQGMPLAIELASAWVRAISLREIASEIERNLDFLSTTLRDLPARHRSLRAVFDHSWALLSPSEQKVFARLSVFRGGFSREVARVVAEASLPELSALMDKSLVRRAAADRYEIHELLRQYARDKLIALGEDSAIRNAHLTHYLQLAETADPHLRSRDQLIWIVRLDTEHDNFRMALKWALTDEQVEAGLRLSGALARFWYLRGHWTEGREWVAKFLTISAQMDLDESHRAARIRALNGAGWLANDGGDEVKFYEESLALSRVAGDRWSEAYALRGLATSNGYWGDREHALEYHALSLKLFSEVGDDWGMALARFGLGWLDYATDNAEATLALWNESLQQFREVGDRWGMAVTLGALSYAARFTGDYKQAMALSKESLHLFKELGDRAGVSDSLSRLGSVAYRRSDYGLAIELYEESLTIAYEMGDHWDEAQIKGILGLIRSYQGHYERGVALIEEALAIGRSLYGSVETSFLLSYLGMAVYSQGDLVRAESVWQETEAIYRSEGEKIPLGYSLHFRGLLALHRQDLDLAEGLLAESHTLLQDSGDKRGVALAHFGLARLARLRGDWVKALRLLQTCLNFRKEMSDKQGVAETLEELAATVCVSDDALRFERATQQLGAAEYLREKIGAPLPPVDKAAYAELVASLQSTIADDQFNRLWVQGREHKLAELLSQTIVV